MPVPLATYRVQMRAEFGFDDAAAIAGYLADLGVTHLYSSPYLQAGKGSTHGYDVLDHSKPNAELGGAEGHARLCRALGEAKLGPDPRHRPQPHEHRQPRQPVVVGRPRERPVEPLCRLFRRRLAAARGQAPRHRPDADPRRPLRPRGRGRATSRSSATAARSRFALFRPRDARRPPVAQRPAQRGGRRAGFRRAGVPRRLVRQPADLDPRPTSRASTAGTATRKSSARP